MDVWITKRWQGDVDRGNHIYGIAEIPVREDLEQWRCELEQISPCNVWITFRQQSRHRMGWETLIKVCYDRESAHGKNKIPAFGQTLDAFCKLLWNVGWMSLLIGKLSGRQPKSPFLNSLNSARCLARVGKNERDYMYPDTCHRMLNPFATQI